MEAAPGLLPLPAGPFGARDACTGERIWLPRAGWTVVNRELADRMERKLNVPMILIALCVIPLLALDYYQPEHHPLVHHLHDSIAQQSAPAVSATNPGGRERDSGSARLAQLPAVRFATRIGEALIWTAFALEFTVMISVVDRKFRYCRQHWVDILVIVLPLVAFLRSSATGAPRDGSIKSGDSPVCIACEDRSCARAARNGGRVGRRTQAAA